MSGTATVIVDEPTEIVDNERAETVDEREEERAEKVDECVHTGSQEQPAVGIPGSLEQVAAVDLSEKGDGAVCKATTRESESECVAERVGIRWGDNSSKNMMVRPKMCQLSG